MFQQIGMREHQPLVGPANKIHAHHHLIVGMTTHQRSKAVAEMPVGYVDWTHQYIIRPLDLIDG